MRLRHLIQLKHYSTLPRACDAVVTKPGYGITAGGPVNGARVLYTSRGDFPEYPILAAALESYGTAAFVSPERLREGAIGEELERLLDRPRREWRLAADGDRVGAERILEALTS
ncbi:MAG: hypothetical protein ACREQ9_16285 [Candidatus Binatia bacterium]